MSSIPYQWATEGEYEGGDVVYVQGYRGYVVYWLTALDRFAVADWWGNEKGYVNLETIEDAWALIETLPTAPPMSGGNTLELVGTVLGVAGLAITYAWYMRSRR